MAKFISTSVTAHQFSHGLPEAVNPGSGKLATTLGAPVLVIGAARSLKLTSKDLQYHKDGVRFVSVDGAHWFKADLNDLRLAASTAGSNCVIALDDFFNPDYPEVSAAYFA
jgi:hypothetical protein